MEHIEYFQASAHKIQTPGNHPEELIQLITNKETEIQVARFDYLKESNSQNTTCLEIDGIFYN
jgi:hypothetical protein